MDLTPTPRSAALRERLQAFMAEHVDPVSAEYEALLHAERPDRWAVPAVFFELQARAKQAGLWNLFLPHAVYGAPGLSNLEYAPLAEVMGHVGFASEVFNCNAPDSGNMELLLRYGSPEQQRKYLEPLAGGRTKSVFCMTEPDVASSDATNIRTRIERDGDDYVINGRKWWSTNALDPRAAFYIVMGKTDPAAPIHRQQSQVLVDVGAPGVTVVRALPIFGFHDEPHGHAEIRFENVRVPAENMILGEGRGFEISQGRLGPGRIHHCMRIIGVAERLLEMLCRRLLSRTTFGKLLADQSLWQERIAIARTEIEMCRLLVLKAAYMMDTVGNRVARSEIAQIKVAVPLMAQRLCDVTIQAHGAAGVCDDFGLGYTYARLRVMRLGDGPDEVHNRTISRTELDKYPPGAAGCMTGISRQALFSGTEPPPAHLALDLAPLDAWLARNLDGYRGPLEVEKFRGGQSNPTYRLATPSARYVLRKKPPGSLLPSAHAVDREYRVIAALHQAGFPVPRPYLLCEDENVVGTAFYMVEHVDGRVFWEVDLPGLSPDERTAIYDSMNATLAALHALDPAAIGLGDFGRPGNYLQRHFDRWSKQYRAAQSENLADMEWLLANLPALIPQSNVGRLVHGDYGLHNIIIHKTEPRVAAVLDWEISTLGDPLGDIGHHMTAWSLPPDPERGSVSSLVGHDLAALGIPAADDYIDHYLARCQAPDFDRQFVLAFALFRYAAIIQGVMKRAASGTGANKNMMHTQPRVGLLAAAARRLIDR